MPAFKDMMDDMPSWQELGREVEVVRADGSRVIGLVTYTDFSPGPDEFPYLEVEAGDQRFGWFDFEQWRYTKPRAQAQASADSSTRR